MDDRHATEFGRAAGSRDPTPFFFELFYSIILVYYLYPYIQVAAPFGAGMFTLPRTQRALAVRRERRACRIANAPAARCIFRFIFSCVYLTPFVLIGCVCVP